VCSQSDLFLQTCVGSHSLIEQVYELERERKDDGGIFLDTYLGECLEIAELEGHGLLGHKFRSFNELCGGVEFACGVDDLGFGLAFGFCLLGHCA